MGVEETPRFDAYDNVYGRSRLEGKLDNLLFGRDAESGEAWQVARLTLYHGGDFANEIRKSTDYELELDLRPRPWWGFQFIGENHSTSGEYNLDDPFLLQRRGLELYERFTGDPPDPEYLFLYNAQYGDYERALTMFYYDGVPLEKPVDGRLGFAYTRTMDKVYNREFLYGLGYRFSDKWSLAFEHRYDLERDELYRQEYEIRRRLHCWEGALMVRERSSGWDLGVEFSVTAIPGAKLKF